MEQDVNLIKRDQETEETSLVEFSRFREKSRVWSVVRIRKIRSSRDDSTETAFGTLHTSKTKPTLIRRNSDTE